MKHRYGWLFSLFLALVTMIVLTREPVVQAQSAVPTQEQVPSGDNVNPRSGAPGQVFSFSSDKFDGNESISIWINAPDGTIIPIDVKVEMELPNGLKARNGYAQWIWKSPTDTKPGTYSMVAQGSK
jgi:hypothetical protein